MSSKECKECGKGHVRLAPEPEYAQYRRLLTQLAYKHSGGDPDRFDRLMSQANLAFVMACRSWRPELGKFSTHLYWTARDYISRRTRADRRLDNMERYESGPTRGDVINIDTIPSMDAAPDRVLAFKQAVNALGTEAAFVVRLVLEAPLELVDLTAGTVAPTITSITRYLRARRWTQQRICCVFKEIQVMLNTL